MGIQNLDIYSLKTKGFQLEEIEDKILENLQTILSTLQILNLILPKNTFLFDEKMKYFNDIISRLENNLSLNSISIYAAYFSSRANHGDHIAGKNEELITKLEEYSILEAKDDIEKFMIFAIKYVLLELYSIDLEKYYSKMIILLEELEANKEFFKELQEIYNMFALLSNA